MAESEMFLGAGATRVAHLRGGMGILRLLRQWPAEQVAAGGRTEPWPEPAFQPAGIAPTAASDSAPHLVIDRRTTSLALRHTIAAWRAAERELDGLAADSREWARVHADVDLLRLTHHRLFTQLRRTDRS